MSKDEQYAYIFLLIGSIVFLIWIVPNQIDVGENASVSPRLMPQLLAGGIGLISAFQLGRSFLEKGLVRQEITINAESYRALALVIVLLWIIAYIANILPVISLGFVAIGRFWIASIILVPAMLLLAGVRNRRQIIWYTVILVGVAFVFTAVTGIYIS
ncbi:MAG: hypothetical protein AAF614_37110 [Chloroflexota bacterium]